MAKYLNISTDNTLGGSGASDNTVSSQKAVKGYIDNKTLGELSDVTISSPSAGQNLTYDATNQVWKNTSTSATIAWGGITGTLADQTDLKNALDSKLSSITSTDVTTALGYTPYNSTNPNGYQANVIETVKVNGTALTPSSKAVDITVPTSASDVGAVASNTAITGATKCKITYDSKGLVTAGADLQASDIPDISATYQTKITSSNKIAASNVSGLATVATSGSYSDLTGTPTIPTVNNATLTIQKNGTTVNTFTANASSNVTANITVPTTASDVGAVPTTRTVNSKALSADITLTASDVGALPSSTVIPTVNDATLTITQGGVSKGTFTANASSNATIALDAGAEPDNSTISLNASNKLQTIGVINQRDNSALKIWQGTEAQWNNGGAPISWYNWRTSINANVSSSTLSVKAANAIPVYGNGVFFISCGISSFTAYYSTDNGATWQTTSLTGSSVTWKFAYGNGVFVAMTSSDTAYYSMDNGATWHSATLPSSGSWTAPVYGNEGVFVTTLNYAPAYSTDYGATWQNGGSFPSSESWGELVYGNGVFVTVAFDSDKAAYSTDNSATWNSATLPSSGRWRKPAYGNGVFVTVDSASNAIAYSTDNGATWHSATLPSSGSWTAPTYANGVFVTIKSGYSEAAYSTDNGATWHSATLPSSGSWTAPAYGNGVFVTSAHQNKIAYSTDYGATWQDGGSLTSSFNWSEPVYGNGVFITVSYGKTNYALITFPFSQCFTSEASPTTSSTVYSEPETASALTISSVTSGAITLSDNNTYYYTQSGNEYTYESVGVSYPDWLCFINGVGVKIGTTVIATYNGV